MAYWMESESIHFDWVLYDMFETWIEYDEAFYEWSDMQWTEEFKEKFIKRDFEEDIKTFVKSEFQRFIVYRRERIKREEEEEERKRQEELEERRQQEEEANRPRTPFEVVLSQVFNHFFEIIWAIESWTEEEWHKRFEEKILVQLEEGVITEQTAEQIRMDLKDYMEKVYKDYAEYEAEQSENEEQYELERRKKEEEEERRLEELRARDKRKAKQLPEVLKLIERYQNIKAEIQKSGSEDTYKELFEICYLAIENWGIVGCLDEFNDVWEYYEQQVLEYFNTVGTIYSLYQVVFYYTNGKIVWAINDLSDRKEHLLKGLTYVKGLYEITEFEKDAKRYLDVYGMLRNFCRTGEDLEELRYTTKEYKLAKEFAVKYQSEEMLDALDWARKALALYYRDHNQEKDAIEVEKESAKIIAQIRSQRGE